MNLQKKFNQLDYDQTIKGYFANSQTNIFSSLLAYCGSVRKSCNDLPNPRAKKPRLIFNLTDK